MQKRRRVAQYIPHSPKEEKRQRVQKIGESLATSDTVPTELNKAFDSSESSANPSIPLAPYVPAVTQEKWYNKVSVWIAIAVPVFAAIMFILNMFVDIRSINKDITTIKDDIKDGKERTNRMETLIYDTFKKKLQR